MKRDFDHWIITRFNLNSGYREDVNDLKWLEERFQLLENYCLQSIINQRCKNFKWLILFDMDLPALFKEKVDVLKEKNDSIHPIYLSKWSIRELKENCVPLLKSKYLITTRLDSDDMLSETYVCDVQNIFDFQADLLINFDEGYFYDAEKKIVLKSNSYKANPFMSYVEKITQDIRTVFMYNHDQLKNYVNLYTVNNRRNWMILIHGGNVRNRIKGYPTIGNVNNFLGSSLKSNWGLKILEYWIHYIFLVCLDKMRLFKSKLIGLVKKILPNFVKRTLRKLGISRDYLKDYKNVNYWSLKINSLNLRYDTSDRYSKSWFFPRYSNGNIHEPEVTRIFFDKVRSSDTILDIGAHLGYFTCIAAGLAKDGVVHAFEVDPKCVDLIKKNLGANNLNNVQVHNLAVSRDNGTIRIPQKETPDARLRINENKQAGEFIEIDAINIDAFVEQSNVKPTFIKIDVEGAEWEVLNGMKKTLMGFKGCLLVEVHVEILKQHFDTDYTKVLNLLIDLGYSLSEVEHRNLSGSRKFLKKDSLLSGNTMLLCTKL